MRCIRHPHIDTFAFVTKHAAGAGAGATYAYFTRERLSRAPRRFPLARPPSSLEMSASDAVRTNALKFAVSLVLAFCSQEGADGAASEAWSVAPRAGRRGPARGPQSIALQVSALESRLF